MDVIMFLQPINEMYTIILLIIFASMSVKFTFKIYIQIIVATTSWNLAGYLNQRKEKRKLGKRLY